MPEEKARPQQQRQRRAATTHRSAPLVVEQGHVPAAAAAAAAAAGAKKGGRAANAAAGGTDAGAESYDWAVCLEAEDNAVPVAKFGYAAHLPLHRALAKLPSSLKLEVPNVDYDKTYWYATVVKVAGYRVLLRYFGHEPDADGRHDDDFWMNLCASDVHHVGWAAETTRPICPPRAIGRLHTEWRPILTKGLVGSRTLPTKFPNLVRQALVPRHIAADMRIETFRQSMPQKIIPCRITCVMGNRINVKPDGQSLPANYLADVIAENPTGAEASPQQNYWMTLPAWNVFPVGWAHRAGYPYDGNGDYRRHCDQLAKCLTLPSEDDLQAHELPAMFERAENADPLVKWKVGLKFELLDMLDMNCVRVATVEKLLEDEWMTVSVDGDSDKFAVHQRSPYLFPAGFANASGGRLPINPPKADDDDEGGACDYFDWEKYLSETLACAAPSDLFDQNRYDTGFKVGSRLECTDAPEPHLVAPACVAAVLANGRLLRIHFIGWVDTMDQFQDFRSSELHPVGWCEAVGHKLQPPGTVKPAE